MAEERKPRRARRSDFAHMSLMTTRWMDNDVYGHLNNVVYYSLFDTAVNATSINNGLLSPTSSDAIGLVVETGCRYAAALSFPDSVEAAVRVARLGASSVRYEIGLFKQGEEEAAAEGFFVHVNVDSATRRPTPIPSATRTFLQTLKRESAA